MAPMNPHSARTWIELNIPAIYHNITTIERFTNHKAIFGAVIKGNAYGHGADDIIAMLDAFRPQSWLCVAGVNEGLRIRTNRQKILSMAYLDGDLAAAVHCGIRLTGATYDDLHAINQVAAAVGMPAYVHLKIDTGMHRRGFFPATLPAVAERLRDHYPWIAAEGIYTHLGDTSNEDMRAISEPWSIFIAAAHQAESLLKRTLIKHALASGALWYPETGDMIRVGSMLYGIWKSKIQEDRYKQRDASITIHPVLSWKTIIMELKKVPQGAYIGYNRGYYADRPMTIAILPIGYADGYPRDLSHCGAVMVAGTKAPIVGLIGMNLMTIDVTHIPHAQRGDIVTLIGDELPVQCATLAALLTTTPLELLARIDKEIPRYSIPLPQGASSL